MEIQKKNAHVFHFKMIGKIIFTLLLKLFRVIDNTTKLINSFKLLFFFDHFRINCSSEASFEAPLYVKYNYKCSNNQRKLINSPKKRPTPALETVCAVMSEDFTISQFTYEPDLKLITFLRTFKTQDRKSIITEDSTTPKHTKNKYLSLLQPLLQFIYLFNNVITVNHDQLYIE